MKKHNLKFKSFDYDSINNLLSYVRDEYEESSKDSIYIEFSKLRYVRLSSILKCIFHRDCKLFSIIKVTYFTFIKLILRVLSGKAIIFSSNSDIVHIRNHLSVFYLADNLRIKLFVSGGTRGLMNITNEIAIRKKLSHQNMHLRVPQFINSFNKNGLVGYMDRIVFGSTLNWNDKNSDYVTQQLVDNILSYYRQQKVIWCLMREHFPDMVNNINEIARDDKLYDILDKKVACSLIHGDLSLGNVIVDDKEDLYIIDWELSKFGLIVCDLLKIINNKPIIIPKVNNFLNKVSYNNDQIGVKMASFNEQLLLAHFIKDNNLVWE
jgi:hypothetical protein